MSDLKCAGCAVSVTLINDLTREKSVATSDLICAHREIERHKQEIARLDGEVAKLKRELRYARYFEVDDECIKSMSSGLEEATESHPALHSIVDDTLNNMIQLLRQRDEARRERDDMRPVYEAAKEWREAVARVPRPSDADVRLALTVDKAEDAARDTPRERQEKEDDRG